MKRPYLGFLFQLLTALLVASFSLPSLNTAYGVTMTFLHLEATKVVATSVKYPAEIVAVRVGGLETDATYTLRASNLGFDGKVYQSSADFKADANGMIDSKTSTPLSGTYKTSDPEGLFWSMLPETKPTVPTGPNAYEFSLAKGGTLLLTATLTKGYLKPGVRRVDLKGTGLVGELYLPAEAGTRPAVITFGGSEGGAFTGEINAAALANEGFVALGLGYFGAPGLPPDLVNIPLEYFQTAITFLQSRSEVNPEAIAVMGCSRGGELALLLGATFPAIRAVIGQAPSPFRFPGNVDADSSGHWRPAWTFQGKAFPFIDFEGDLVPVTLPDGRTAYNNAPAFLKGLQQDPKMVRAARSPIEKTHGPILMYGGDDDQVWPSCLLANLALIRLKDAEHPYDDEVVCYQDAGHSVSMLPGMAPTSDSTSFHVPMNMLLNRGGTPLGNAVGQRKAWDKTLQFLRKNLM